MLLVLTVAPGFAGPPERPDVRITLGPLTVEDLAGVVTGADEAHRIIEDTGGVPVLVAEHLRGADSSVVTAGMKTHVELRLESLTELAAQVVAAAAVAGGTFDAGILRSVSGRSEEEVADAAEELVRRQILREIPGFPSSLGFTLFAMEQTIYESLSPIRRRLLHGRAADALLLAPRAGRDPATALVIADHLRLAGRETEAADMYGRAGDLAASLYATVEAERAYRAALALEPENRAGLQLALGDVLLRQSRFRDALDAYQAAAVLGDPTLAARAEHRLGDTYRRLGRFELAESHFALAELEHPALDGLLADWALLDLRRGDRAAAEDRARRAVQIAVDGGSTAAQSRARDVLGIVTDDVSELRQAVDLADDDLEARMASMNSLAHAIAGQGRVEEALRLVTGALEIAASIGDRHRRAALHNHLADLHHRLGEDEASRAALTQAVQLFADVQEDAWEPEVWLLTRW